MPDRPLASPRTPPNASSTGSPLAADEVAAYLRRHADFLSAYPDLASTLVLPREQGAAASLAVYQLQGLREKNAQLQARLAELTAIAAENQTLMQRVHALTVAIAGAGSRDAVARSVIGTLERDFHTEHVRLVLFDAADLPPAPGLITPPEGAAALPEFAELLEAGEPVTGRLSTARRDRLFGPYASAVHSAAVMPLDRQGLLAIGSGDADRFQPGMGTLFLKMIAATVGAALTREGR